MLQALLTEVKGSTAVKESTANVKISNADVKSEVQRSSAEVASTLHSILSQFQSQSRDANLVRALTVVVPGKGNSDHATCEAREKSVLERLHAVEKELQTSRARESELTNALKTLSAERDKFEAALKSATATSTANELARAKAEVEALRAHLDRIRIGTTRLSFVLSLFSSLGIGANSCVLSEYDSGGSKSTNKAQVIIVHDSSDSFGGSQKRSKRVCILRAARAVSSSCLLN